MGGYSHHYDHVGHPLPGLTSAPSKHTVTLDRHCGIPETPWTSTTSRIDTLVAPIPWGLPAYCLVSIVPHIQFMLLSSPCPCVEEREWRSGLSCLWIEEAGCQACEQLSLGERVCWGSDFSWRESSSSYKAQIILDLACCWSPRKGGVAADGLCDSEGVHS
jgi:hypothetical protein